MNKPLVGDLKEKLGMKKVAGTMCDKKMVSKAKMKEFKGKL